MDNVALLGHPVKGALWPQAMAALGRLLDRDLKAKAVDVEPAKLAAAVEKLRAAKFAGARVAAPNTRAALSLRGAISAEARAVGGADCLKLEADGLKVHAVAAVAFYDLVAETGFRARDSVCQILGSGVTAKAAAYALGRAGARHVKIWAKKPAEAEALSKEVGVHWPDTAFSAGPAGPAELWVNCLSAEGQKPEKPPVKALAGAVVAVDYDCGKGSKFLDLGAAARARCITGLPLLVYESIRCWEAWFGPVGGPGRSVLKGDVMRLKRWK